jgi:DNA-directed RNA polymerase subunit M/transcription elongation factor TFIIS
MIFIKTLLKYSKMSDDIVFEDIKSIEEMEEVEEIEDEDNISEEEELEKEDELEKEEELEIEMIDDEEMEPPEKEEEEIIEDSKDDDKEAIDMSECNNYFNNFRPNRTKTLKIKNKYCKPNKKKESRNNDKFKIMSRNKICKNFKNILSEYMKEEHIDKIISLLREYADNKSCNKEEEKKILCQFLYIFLGILLKENEDITKKFIISIKSDYDYFELKIFDKEKKHFEYNRDATVLAELEIVEGIHTCRKCSNNKTVSYKLQTRGADEPMTIFIRCVSCSNRWRE